MAYYPFVAPEPAAGSRVRDVHRRVWRSWEDGLGNHWWGLVDNEDADPMTWRTLEYHYGPLTLV